MQSPVNESFQQIFSVYDFKVLGEVNAALRNILEGWKPSYLSYEAGFNKKYNLAVNQILKTLILLLAFAFVGCSNNKNDVVINDPEQYDLVKDIIWAST